MVISECDGHAETKVEEDMWFNSHSASGPHGSETEMLVGVNCCFNL